jgi:hypothetical protein
MSEASEASIRRVALERQRHAQERERRALNARAAALRLAEIAETPEAARTYLAQAERHAQAAALQHAAVLLQAEHARQHAPAGAAEVLD